MTTSSRRGAAAVIGWLLVLAWIWCSVGTASAGGPTSVIMVNPGTGQAAALHTSDVRYDRLVEAVRAYYPPAGPTARPASVTDCSGCEIRLTWLIHDMRIWRIDRVHLTPDDGIWLESVSDETGRTDPFEQTGTWQRPHDPTALLALLSAAEVAAPRTAGQEPGATKPDSASADDGPPIDASTRAAASASGRDALTTVLVAISSAVVGLVIGLGVDRRRRSRADRIALTG